MPVTVQRRHRALSLEASPFLPGREILPGVHRVWVAGSSVILLEGPRLTLVDSGPRGSGARILRYLRRIGRSPDELDTIVLTHYHPDHAGGAAELLELTGARLAAHAVETPFLRGELQMPNPIRHQALAAAARPLLPWLMPQPTRVDFPLHDGDELPALGGLRVVHTPGHTPGSICLASPARGVLFVGDALQWKRGRLCPPSRHFSEDLELAMRSIRRLAGMDVGMLCFSHFPMALDGDAHLRALVAL